jgi:hypothetical protein
MGSSNNAIAAYLGAPQKDSQESIGITQFPSEHEFNQIIGGLIIQGGKVSSIAANGQLTIPFNHPFPKKVLNIQITAISPDGTTAATPKYSGAVYSVTLNSFVLINDGSAGEFYWWAIGI